MSNNSINGWKLISKWLGYRQKKQKDLAKILKVSDAAISQMKKGDILLKPTQMKKIISTLRFSPEDIHAYYDMITESRAKTKRPGVKKKFGKSEITPPYARKQIRETSASGKEFHILTINTIYGFEHENDSLDAFAFNKSDEKLFFPVEIESGVILKLENPTAKYGLLPYSSLLLDCINKPEPGNLTVFKARSGEMDIGVYSLNNNQASLLPVTGAPSVYSWALMENEPYYWIFPVKAVYSTASKMEIS